MFGEDPAAAIGRYSSAAAAALRQVTQARCASSACRHPRDTHSEAGCWIQGCPCRSFEFDVSEAKEVGRVPTVDRVVPAEFWTGRAAEPCTCTHARGEHHLEVGECQRPSCGCVIFASPKPVRNDFEVAVCPQHLRFVPCRRCPTDGPHPTTTDELVVEMARRYQTGQLPFTLDVDRPPESTNDLVVAGLRDALARAWQLIQHYKKKYETMADRARRADEQASVEYGRLLENVTTDELLEEVRRRIESRDSDGAGK